MNVFSATRCRLGEGPLWHPQRQQLYWFDILGKRLLTIEDGAERIWSFAEHVSAAGWVDPDCLLIASETALFRFNTRTGAREDIAALEACTDATRSNDGRADPWGGFWIGTMGKKAQAGRGAIYRFFRGEVALIVPEVTISNAICFAPDRSRAFYADTLDGQIMAQPLDGEGWPTGQAEVFIDLRSEGLNPDGAVVDAEGCLWNAQWGASRLACYGPDGKFRSAVDFPVSQVTCPAFGGANFDLLLVTSAADGVPGEVSAGQTFFVDAGTRGLPEHQVIL